MPKRKPSSREITLNDNTLNERHIAFVREYLKDRNATQAAIRAGYSKNCAGVTGFHLLERTNIRRLLKERELDLMRSAEIDEAWVLKHLKNNAVRAIELDDLGACNRSLELIGKQIGMFVDRSSINIAFEQIERVERRIVDPVIDVDYSVDEKKEG